MEDRGHAAEPHHVRSAAPARTPRTTDDIMSVTLSHVIVQNDATTQQPRTGYVCRARIWSIKRPADRRASPPQPCRAITSSLHAGRTGCAFYCAGIGDASWK